MQFDKKERILNANFFNKIVQELLQNENFNIYYQVMGDISEE